ncbi:12252_t:CDS:2, partial [Dentiscutata erythropus]
SIQVPIKEPIQEDIQEPVQVAIQEPIQKESCCNPEEFDRKRFYIEMKKEDFDRKRGDYIDKKGVIAEIHKEIFSESNTKPFTQKSNKKNRDYITQEEAD